MLLHTAEQLVEGFVGAHSSRTGLHDNLDRDIGRSRKLFRSQPAQNDSDFALPLARLTHSASDSASIVARRLATLYDLPTSRIASAGPALNDVGILAILSQEEERTANENQHARQRRGTYRRPIDDATSEQ